MCYEQKLRCTLGISLQLFHSERKACMLALRHRPVSDSITNTTTTVTTGSRSKVHTYRAKELTFGKPLICSPARKGERRRTEEGGEKEGMEREERSTGQEEERAFKVSKRKAAITEPPSLHLLTSQQHCCHHTQISNVTCQV